MVCSYIALTGIALTAISHDCPYLSDLSNNLNFTFTRRRKE